MASVVEIYNMALGNLGIGVNISDTAEAAPEARQCNRFYETARDFVLERFPWPFATRYYTLTLVAEEPNPDWLYSYRRPADCVKVRRILSQVSRIDITPIPFNESRDNSGGLIFTDEASPIIEYTYRETQTAYFTPSFVIALSWKLAAMIGPGLTGGDPFKMVARAEKNFELSIVAAEAYSLNGIREDQMPDAESIRARD